MFFALLHAEEYVPRRFTLRDMSVKCVCVCVPALRTALVSMCALSLCVRACVLCVSVCAGAAAV